MERVDDIGGKAFVKQAVQNVAAVMTGGFKPCFYFAQILRRIADSLTLSIKQLGEAVNHAVLERTGGRADAEMLMAAALAAAGVWRLRSGFVWPCAFNLFWWALGVIGRSGHEST